MGKGKGKGQGKSEAKDKAPAVQPGITLDVAKQLGDVDSETAGRIVSSDPYLLDFRCTVKNEAGKGVLELLASPEGLKCAQMAMTAVCSDKWKPTRPQELLAAAMGHFMQLAGLRVPADVVPVAAKFKLEFDEGLANEPQLNRQEWPDQTRLLYIIEVEGSPVFKLGTFFVDYSHGRRTVLCRYFSNRGRDPPAHPEGVDWTRNKLTVRKVIVVPTADEEPDKEIHTRLRLMAKDKNLLSCGQTEFHDRALLLAAEAELESMGPSSSGSKGVEPTLAEVPTAEVLPAEVLPAEVSPPEVLPAVVLTAGVIPAQDPEVRPVVASNSSSGRQRRFRSGTKVCSVDWGNSLRKKAR